MATVTKPMALDESINTTESTSRNIADVLAQELSGIASAITGGSDKANKTDIATVEPTNTASRAYSVGELVYVNGNLYKVITAIASGATFTVGTNIQSANVSNAIDDISAENVSYGSGTVKDALDGLTSNNMGNGVAVTAGTAYTTPSNGYLQIYTRANSEVDLSVLSSGNSNGVRFDVNNTASSGIYQFTYVTKGLRVLWSASTANNGFVSFYPLV